MSSRTWNKAMIIGNLGGEPRLTSTGSGTPVCTFTVATNRSWIPKGSSERREDTEWHYVVAFGKLAEICSRILTKGTKAFVSGRIQNRRIVSQDGEEKRRTEIVAANLIALDRRKDSSLPSKEKNGQEEEGK
jgi:single-strand DNA-binding protein